MKKLYRYLCTVLAVIMSTLCLSACSFFEDDDNDGPEPDDKIEIVLSDDSDPFVIEVGQTIKLSVLSPIGDPVWESADPEIASVSSKGELTGKSQGSTVLGVSVNDYYTVRTVVVMPSGTINPPEPVPEETVTISTQKITVEVGNMAQIMAWSNLGNKINWSSADSAVATVDDGKITGVKEGVTVIYARTDGGKRAMCAVTVIAAEMPETITLNRDRLLVYAGDSAELTATATKGSPVTWSSSNTAVATVSGGKIAAIAVGKTTITASIPNGASASCTVEVLNSPGADIPHKSGYTLTWNDEFDGAALDPAKWNYQTGVRDVYNGIGSDAWFWGNNELQYYTDSQQNVNVENGKLNITAIKENMADGRTYSSGRIITRDKFSQTYGWFEVRMKTPTGNGMWPAFWLLPQPNGSYGANNVYGGWPHSGEIDIMEAKGRLRDMTDHTLHFSLADTGAHNYLGTTYALSSDTDEWHTYAVDWTPDYIIWYVDGEQAYRLNSVAWTTQASSAPSAPFDKPFYILLNLAVGGNYDGGVSPDGNFTRATMQVDYVRVWQKDSLL